MKTKERLQARKLRKEEGWQLSKIAEHLNVAKSSVSLWVRDIELTPEQHEVLRQLNPLYNNQLRGWAAHSETHKQRRLQYQNIGRQKIRDGCSDLYKIGCMLYWAEGAKDKNSVRFCNTDPNMMRLFMDFILGEFDIGIESITIKTNVYLNNGITFENIKQYWDDLLGLADDNWRKSQINILPKSSKKKQNRRHKYGVCYIDVHKTKMVQEIFGAIKEISGIKNDELWL